MNWADLSAEVFRFALALRGAGLMPDDEDEYWERPHKWEPEHARWVAAGGPPPPENPGAPQELAWERFVRSAP